MSANLDLMKEVDSFIQQAKLEGEISCSISSVGSNSTGMSIQAINSVEINEIKQSNNLDACFMTPEDLTEFACSDNTVSNQIEQNCKIIEDILKDNTKHCRTKSQLSEICDLTDNIENLIDLDTSEEIKLIFDKAQSKTFKYSKTVTKSRSLFKRISSKDNDKYNKKQFKSIASEDENSCDSSIVELGNDSHCRKMPYVLWLQEHRSKQSIDSEKRGSKHGAQREAVHIHHVNSALFWERWMDNIFEAYDKWMTYSSESEEDEDLKMMRARSLNDFRRRHVIEDQANRIKSEQVLRRKSGHSNQLKSLRYKCPSYVDWLITRRREGSNKSESEESEEKEPENYWSSLYGKLTKSLSSMLTGKAKDEDDLLKWRTQSAPHIRGSNINALSPSGNKSKSLRKAYSQTCSHRYDISSFRYRQLSEESVESPVLTDQLVELVCNTLSPETTDDSSNDEHLRRRNRTYKRTFKRKS